MSAKHIFLDAGFKNELSYRFSFFSEAEHIKKMLSELIGNSGSGSLQFRIIDDDLTLRIIACDDVVFLMLKTMIELNKECSLITLSRMNLK